MSFRVLPLLLVAIIACSQSRDRAVRVDSAPAPAPIVSGSVVMTISSSPVTDFDGDYAPDSMVTASGYELEYIELGGVPYLQFHLASAEDSVLYASCFEAAIVTADTLHLRCGADPVGTITVDGHFLDREGHFAERGMGGNLVLEAVLRVGDLAPSPVVLFVYVEGD